MNGVKIIKCRIYFAMNPLVNVYVDLLAFTCIAGTSWTGSGRYWCKYYIEKHAVYVNTRKYQQIDVNIYQSDERFKTASVVC